MTLKKTFCLYMFGTTFPWMKEWVPHVQHLGKYGWHWKIFTPNKDVQSVGNVEFIDMSCDQFVDLCEKKIGVRPNLYITSKGVPSVHVTDFIVANGVILEDYLKDTDYVGMTNLDVVYGRLDHFIPDDILSKCDVMSDDINSINGVFSLYKNKVNVNNLFREIEDWEKKFTLPPCSQCVEGKGGHTLAGTDEYDMSEVCKNAAAQNRIKYLTPHDYPMHSHDRMEQHTPKAKLEIKPDGSLFELFADVNPPKWIHARPFLGREIGYYHFNVTKTWPKCLLSTEKTVS